eukprot:scaffold271186_cov39-Tisochrysis_lutea.AAC.2
MKHVLVTHTLHGARTIYGGVLSSRANANALNSPVPCSLGAAIPCAFLRRAAMGHGPWAELALQGVV